MITLNTFQQIMQAQDLVALKVAVVLLEVSCTGRK
jgi:hypothetical protein